MRGLFSSKANTVQVGVDFMPKGVAVVKVATGKKNLGQVLLSAFLPAVGDSEQAKVLHQWVEKNKLTKAPCVSLIARHDVQMFQLEKPAVEDAAELLQAVTWKIKDLINFDVETAVVDVFQLPPSPKNPKKYLNAVVANQSVVGAYVDKIKQSGLKLEAINIHDLVNKNLCKVYDFTEQTIAVLQFSETTSLMNIYHNEDMYVARDFKIGLLEVESAMDSDAAETGGIEQEEPVYDSLLLEVQRSMDYFESSYGLGMVKKVLVFPRSPATERMLNYLQNYVGFEFDFAEVVTHQNAEDIPLDTHCFSAYCASLRGAGA